MAPITTSDRLGRIAKHCESEARAVAALNHPNICQLYGVGRNYLVMEYIDGVPVAPHTDGLETSRKLVDILCRSVTAWQRRTLRESSMVI